MTGYRSRRMRCGTAVAVLGLAWALAPGAPAQTPSDPRQGEQWATAPGALLHLPGAWELSQGAGAVVAVIDSGTRLNHEDLARNAWVNFKEVPGNGVDDDANGYVDDVHGVDLTTKARTQNLTDGHGHGTHVAGIIAASANRKGVVGVAPRAKIMTVKVLDARGAGSTGAVAEGVRYAAANGARIINMSLGGDTRDPRLREAIDAAAAANVIVICSAGNDGRNVDSRPSFPVSFPAPNLIGVAATSPADGRRLGSFSNFGKLTIGLAAPGEGVLSTSNSGAYELKSGTSMAAPMATGVAALMVAARPDISAPELRALLLQNAGRSSLPVGAGYLDALGSVLAVARAVSLKLGQPPLVRILVAHTTGSGRRAETAAQVAVLGSTDAIRGYRVRLNGRRVAVLRSGRLPFTVRLRGKRGRTLTVEALDAKGAAIAKASRRVATLKRGKGGVGRGGGVGSGRVWIE